MKFKLEVNVSEKELIDRTYKSMLVSNADLMVANDLKHMRGEKQKAFIIDPLKKVIKARDKKDISKKLLLIIAKNYDRESQTIFIRNKIL